MNLITSRAVGGLSTALNDSCVTGGCEIDGTMNSIRR
jgi:hypothetical protein